MNDWIVGQPPGTLWGNSRNTSHGSWRDEAFGIFQKSFHLCSHKRVDSKRMDDINSVAVAYVLWTWQLFIRTYKKASSRPLTSMLFHLHTCQYYGNVSGLNNVSVRFFDDALFYEFKKNHNIVCGSSDLGYLIKLFMFCLPQD